MSSNQLLYQVCLVCASLVLGSFAAYAYSVATETAATDSRLLWKLAASATLAPILYYSYWHILQVRKALPWKSPVDDQPAPEDSWWWYHWLHWIRVKKNWAWPLQKADLAHLVETIRIVIITLLRTSCIALIWVPDKTWLLQVRSISVHGLPPTDGCRYHHPQV